LTEIGAVLDNIIGDSISDSQLLGSILPGNELKIADINTNETLGPNKIGEIRVRGPIVTKGYFKLPNENAELFDDERFLRTGDAGYYDENGNIYFSDRYKQIIKYNGRVVSPTELELILMTHPSVFEAAVIGVKHEIHGELPKAFVLKKEGNELITEQELIDYVSDNVTFFKRLTGGLVFTKYFERTIFGKINKTLLR